MTRISIIGALVRIIALIGALALLVFSSFRWGKNACKAEYEAAIARIRGQHAETVNAAERAAVERALDSQKKELTNDVRVDEIVRSAADDPESMDECVSADIVERLRQLQ